MKTNRRTLIMNKVYKLLGCIGLTTILISCGGDKTTKDNITTKEVMKEQTTKVQKDSTNLKEDIVRVRYEVTTSLKNYGFNLIYLIYSKGKMVVEEDKTKKSDWSNEFLGVKDECYFVSSVTLIDDYGRNVTDIQHTITIKTYYNDSLVGLINRHFKKGDGWGLEEEVFVVKDNEYCNKD